MIRRVVAVVAVVALAGACVYEGGYSGNAAGPKVAILGDEVVGDSAGSVHSALNPSYHVRVAGVDQATVAKMQGVASIFAVPSPRVAVIELGSADAATGVPPAATTAELDAMLEKFPAPVCRVLVNINEHITAAGFDAAAARQVNAAMVPRADQLVDWNAAVAANLDRYTVGPDHLRPNPSGQALLAGLIDAAVSRCLSAPAEFVILGRSIFCSHCFGGVAARSPDDAKTWTSSPAPLIVHDAMKAGGKLVAVGQQQPDEFFIEGAAAVSSDDGKTWTTRHPPDSFDLTAVASTRSGLIAFGSTFDRDSYAIRSTDGGLTWTPYAPAPGTLNAVISTPSGLVAVAGNSVFRSTDDGRTWAGTTASGAARLNGVAASNGVLVVVGYATAGSGTVGYVARSTDGGTTWTPIANQPSDSRQINAIARTPTALIAVGEGTDGNGYVTRSTDNGLAWNPSVAQPPAAIRLSTVAAATNGLVVTAGLGRNDFFSSTYVARSTDDGVRWQAATTQPPPDDFADTIFALVQL